MFAGFNSSHVPDGPTIDPSYFMQAGNGDSMSASMQPFPLESPQDAGFPMPPDYSSLPAPGPLSGTEFVPDEHAAVCTDYSTVGHQYLGDDKISQYVSMFSS